MKEANRLYPPVPSVTRQLSTSRQIDGQWFPEGTPVSIHVYVLHHNPHVWENPEVCSKVKIIMFNKTMVNY